MKKAVLIGVCLVLTACVNSRDPHPVTMKTSSDHNLTCSNIITEYKANTSAATSKISKNNSNDGQDILLGFLIWPGLADFKNADGVEGNALLDRNLFLMALGEEKSCELSSLPMQPSRYN
ncbi:MAG: hypothetical protein OQJ97_09300 [Rhodospirillales bacterium]|nr:hypothetical protein [Rhodospirillales bacterium]